MKKMDETPLMEVINAAAARFDEKPLYRASIEARQELTGKTCHPDISCPTCSIPLVPEHAHMKCPKCHYRDSCCF